MKPASRAARSVRGSSGEVSRPILNTKLCVPSLAWGLKSPGNMTRAGTVRRICDDGLLNAIADGTFGITRRPADGGRGLDGVIERAGGYFNPAAEILENGAAE